MYFFKPANSSISGKYSLASASILLSAIWLPPQSYASEGGDKKNAIAYIIKSGDTLSDLKNKYIRPEISYRLIQKYNGISNEKHLKIGSTLLLPRQYLRFEKSNAQILSLRGNINILTTVNGTARQYKVGDVISEGAIINTGRSSFMSLSLEDGSQISLPSNSNVTLRRMRRYMLERAIDYDFDIAKGGSRTKVAPLRGQNDRFRMRTPRAVSAVRGTEFQMRVDESSDNAISEVTEGSLAVSNTITNNDALLPAGNGWAVTKTGREIKEKLLPAPQLINPSQTQKDDLLNFTLKPLAGAGKYRISLAKDATFLEQIGDHISETEIVALPTIDNGRYFVRASAMSPNGIEGLSNIYSFKRTLNSITAQGGASDDGFLFKWVSRGEGPKNYHFQLFASNGQGKPLSEIAIVDESGLDANSVTISDIGEGEYVWRLGTILFADGEVDTSWTEYQKLSVGAE